MNWLRIWFEEGKYGYFTITYERRIRKSFRKSNEEFNNGNYNDSIVLLEEAWDIIPDPKGIYCEESYHLVKDIISTCFMVNDLKKQRSGQIKYF